MSAKVTISFAVSDGYKKGDYAMLYSNGGSGDVDWSEPVSDIKYPLFPAGVGKYGFGEGPFGETPFGEAYYTGVPGWGNLPWGHFPWGHGSVIVKISHLIERCGRYKFALGCYDELGNAHDGTPEVITVDVHTNPPQPDRLRKESYNKNTDVLTLKI